MLRRLVEEYLDAGAARGLEGAGRGVRVGPVDDPARAGQPRGARAARPSPHVGRAGADRGRVPLLRRPAAAPESDSSAPPLALSLVRRELDEAMRVTTETLSQVTNLLAIVTAPPIETSTIRHIEVLALQPQVADGRRHHLHRRRHQAHVHVPDARSTPASPTGRRAISTSAWSVLGLGARMLAPTAARPVAVRHRVEFLDALAPVFTELEEAAQATLYVDGTARLLTLERHRRRVRAQRADGDARAPRDAARRCCARRSSERGVASGSAPRTTRRRCARWRSSPPATGCPQRSLGTVSVIGPLRMDYGARDPLRPRGRRAAVELRRRRLRRAMR